MRSILMSVFAGVGILLLPWGQRLLARALAERALATALVRWVTALMAVAAAWIMLVWLQR